MDRRRIELVEAGMPMAPIHHEGKTLDDAAAAALAALVAAGTSVGAPGNVRVAGRVRGRAARTDRVHSLRAWPLDFPPGRLTKRRAARKIGRVQRRQAVAMTRNVPGRPSSQKAIRAPIAFGVSG